MPVSVIAIELITGSPEKSKRGEKKLKGTWVEKEVKIPLLTNDTIFYGENLKERKKYFVRTNEVGLGT